MSRERIDLCGLWRFQPEPHIEGEKAGYAQPGFDYRLWREVRVPCTFEACGRQMEGYEGAGWFRRNVKVPESWQGKRVVLRFEGANYHSKVWFNGQYLGESRDGFLPFEFPLRDLVNCSGDNVLVVMVDNFALKGDVPGEIRGWRPFGGILREVELIATDPLHLDRAAITAEPGEAGGRLEVKTRVKNERSEAVSTALLIQVVDDEEDVLAALRAKPVRLATNDTTEILLAGDVAGVKSWSPGEPNLYTVKAALLLGDQPVDEVEVCVGFRRIEAQEDKLLLNGRPIYLTGFNRHEDSPITDMATDLETVRWDLIEMKEAGANFVRLCHYPHHPGELDACDELGLLAMVQIPVHHWSGYEEGEENFARKLEAAKRQLAKMIERDINHPSLIFWSVSNEDHEERPEVAAGERELIRFVRELDRSRLAVHVSYTWARYPNFAEDDVICINGYPSIRVAVQGRMDGYDLAESTRYWREGLEALHEGYPDKPILIAEFGYRALEGTFGNAYGEDRAVCAIEREFAGMDAPYVCGATIWVWADHAAPGHVKPWGVVSRERRKKMPYWTARRVFREKQGLAGPSKPAVVRPGPAEDTVVMIRPDLEKIPQVPLPEGFSIRSMRLDEVGLWTDIVRDEEKQFTISDETFLQEFGCDLQAVQWRCFMITNEKGTAVGTISAWYDREFKGRDYGLIRWEAIRPTYQYMGLDKAAVSFALNRLAQWHKRCFLVTQVKRLPLIKLCLDLGFLPDLDEPGAVEAWRRIRAALEHPVLIGMSALR